MGRVVSTSDGTLNGRARIVAFAFAGGSHSSYTPLGEALGHTFSFTTLSLPGRGPDQDNPFPEDWPTLIADLTDAVVRVDDGTPLFLFGHSFGALLAYEVARRLDTHGALPVAGLFLSSYPAPVRGNPRHAPECRTHALPDAAFIDVVRRWGFFPEAVLADSDLMRYALPPLRADLRLDETYQYRPGAALRMPCVVFGGTRDASVTPEDLDAWRAHIDALFPCTTEHIDGGHFHFHDEKARARLCASITEHIEDALRAFPPSLAGTPVDADSPLVACLRDGADWGDAQSVIAAIRAWTLLCPDALALKDGERSWTYGQLAAHAAALADALRAAQVGRGDVVGVLLPHGGEYVLTILAAWSVGASVCLLEKSWPDALLGEFVASCSVKQIVTLEALRPRSDRHLPSDRATLVPPAPTVADARAWRPLAPHPADVAFVSLTSGSTGKPKAVLTTHMATSYCFRARDLLYPYRDGEREGVNVFLAWECLRPLMFGRPAIAIADDVIVDPPKLMALLRDERITRLVVTPSLLESVLDFPGLAGQLSSVFSRMHAWFLMGEVVSQRLVDKAAAVFPPSLQLVNAYSTWESLDVCYADLLPPDPRNAACGVPIGAPMPGCVLAVLDEQGRIAPAGATGELYIASPGLGPGYLDDPTRTSERFLPSLPALVAHGCDQPVYRTGDRARLNPDGRWSILGRIDSTVKIRGFKVSLHAIERALDAVDGVGKSLVVPIDDPLSGQPSALAAYVVGTAGAPGETLLARLRQQARANLPEYAVPAHFIGLDAFPLRAGSSRKLDKAALPSPPALVAARDEAPAVPPDGFERQLAEIWCDVLGVASVQRDDHFFELGGNSLSAAKVVGLLGARLGLTLAVVDLYQHSRLGDLVEHCRRVHTPATAPGTRVATGASTPGRTGERAKIAIVGMAGRFPGAASIDAFWRNLVDGVDSLSRFAREQLLNQGVLAEQLDHPDWVPVGQVVEDADKFDAHFFGIGQREAVLMDPQHRLFMETAWSALEQAGYARADNPYRQRTGVFASCGIDGYLVHHLQGGGLRTPLDPGRLMLTEIGNEKDYIATRVAYQLDLGGPAISVGAACSSALVAVVQAAQAIRDGQCDMAIAGAAALSFPNVGFCYEEGLVGSADGRVRPFDAAASGTLFGDAVGAVVLKRLDLAQADGDAVLAVIAGTGLSNDGRMKAGYTAPNPDAQRRCIVDALDMADVGSEQISYVECHATATLIGDAIELKGLSDAFADTRRGAAATAGACVLGCVKGNIGHANCAAGITGLIKTVLQLQHRQRVPTVHFDTLNPKLVPFIEHEASPFRLQRGLDAWTVADPATQLPRRAGVSSFGIGGTNAHVVLEEAPERPRAAPAGTPRARHLLTVSARSRGALARQLAQLADHVRAGDAAQLARAAYTLHVARDAHPLRAAVDVPADPAAASAALRTHAAGLDDVPPRAKPGASVAFCFAGQGSQHAGMARDLYRANAAHGRFRRHFDAACAALETALGASIAARILDADDDTVRAPSITQCGLFAVEHALAATLADYGIRPIAVAGHSIGQYAAAVAAGVLTLEQAARLVATRAIATERLHGFAQADGGGVHGGMLAVRGDEAAVSDWLAGRADVWLAVSNAPGHLVVAGLAPALDEAARALDALGCRCRAVPVSHPFHTPLMQPAADALDALRIPGATPRIPMACNVTGAWLGGDALEPGYWARHLLAPVRWSDNVATLLRWKPDVLLEIGPGTVLASLIGQHLRARAAAGQAPADAPRVLSSQPAAHSDADAAAHFDATLGALWRVGVEIDWQAYHDGETAASDAPLARTPLPGYPFERDSFWTRPEASIYVAAAPARMPAPAAPTPWLVRAAPRPAPRIRLYCFPYAGGSSRSFDTWARTAPDWLDLVAVEWPGRNARAEAPLARNDADDLAAQAALADAIMADAGALPAVFCGLSYGGAAAADLLSGPLRTWAASGQVKGLAVIGRAPLLEQPVLDVPQDQLLLVPAELRDDPLWQEVFRPILDADLAADARTARRIAQRWRAHGRQALLTIPLQLHGGVDDPASDWPRAADWLHVTSAPLADRHGYPGGHDFMMRCQSEIFSRLLDWIKPHGAAVAPATPAPTYALGWQPRLPAHDASPPAIRRCATGDESALADWIAARLRTPDDRAALLCLAADDDPRGARQCAGFVALWQTLTARGCMGTLCLLLPAAARSGPLVGAARVAAAENSAIGVQLVLADDHPDSAGTPPDDRWAAGLARDAAGLDREPWLWRVRGRLLTPRLQPHDGTPLPDGLLGASAGRFLVTGAAGGIGRALVDWLIDVQRVAPQRIVALCRRAGSAPRGTREVAVDLADARALDAALAPLTDIEGIFHLAGTLEDGLVVHLDDAKLQRTLAPKQSLDALLAHAPRWRTQWAIAFSSTSALLGVAGQANYAAANAWLDQLACWPPRDAAMPILSIQWGSWAETGMSARNDRALRRASQDGERPLATGAALAALSALLSGLLGHTLPARQFTVCDVDWPRSPWLDLPVLAALAQPVAHARAVPVAPPAAGATPGVVAPPRPDEPADPIRTFLEAYVSRWDERLDLASLGLDSLDLAQMRNGFFKQFGVQLPLSMIASPDLTIGELAHRMRDAASTTASG
ncbi:polyketide synthase [Burkholderia contaminans]|uniref:type I polyketide synthase n=1 Tax=Burkholderia contaminans TaxID=488447 RepID=UPI0006494B3B|nr:type I polyketide synthase [Burkholderia contaminans]AKM45290.1 polyketide synthase [Burkholderia contaminans]